MSIFTVEEQKEIRAALEVIKTHGEKLHEVARKEHDSKRKDRLQHERDSHHMRDHKFND